MINVGTGNLLLQDDDMSTPHKGVALAFYRTYNSQSQHDVSGSDGAAPSMYGNGWTNTFDAHLSASGPGAITVWDIDGAHFEYSQASNGNYTSLSAGQYATLVSDGGCGFLWTKKSGTTYYFWQPANGPCAGSSWDAAYGAYDGRLYQILGRNHNSYLVFGYAFDNGSTAPGSKVSAISANTESGMTAMMSFIDVSGHRLLDHLTFADGTTTVYYGYDASGNLTWVSRPSNNAAGSRPIQGFGYGPGGLMSWLASPRWNGPDGGAVFLLSYSGTTAPTATISGISHFGVVNPSIPDGTGISLQPGAPTGAVDYNDSWYGTGGSTPWFHDTDGHSTNWVMNSQRPAQTQECTAMVGWNCTGTWLTANETWDSSNNLTSEIDPRGNETDYAYDARGNTVALGSPQVAVGSGNGTRFRPTQLFDYDSSNNLTAYCDQRATHAGQADWSATGPPTNGAPDGLCSATGANHAVFTYGSNAAGMEPFGELTTITTALGFTTTISYALAPQGGTDYGLPTAIRGAPIAQSDGTFQAYQTLYYDVHGNVICAFGDGSAQDTATIVSYDSLNRVVTIADPDDGSIGVPSSCPARNSDISGSTIVTRKTYFPDGSLASVQSPAESAASVSTTFQYDFDGNVKQEQQHHTSTGSPTTKFYDGVDRLVEVVQPTDPSDFYPYPWTTRYIYDLTQGGTVTVGGSAPFRAYGNLYKTEERLPGPTADYNPAAGTSTGGSASSFLDTAGTAFDALDRAVTKYRNTGSGLQPLSNVYDDAASGNYGLLSSSCNALNECTTFSYDEHGRVVRKSFNTSSSTTQQTSYDEVGRVVSLSNGIGSIVDLYDADGRKTARSESTSTGPSATISYHYYANGLRSALDIALAGGPTYLNALTYTYRNDGLPRSVGVMGTSNWFHFSFTGGKRLLSQSDSTAAAPMTVTYGAVGPSSMSGSNYPAVGLATGISAPLWFEQSIHYDAEGGHVTGDNWIYQNGGFLGDSVPVFSKTSRGEVIGPYPLRSIMANGVAIVLNAPHQNVTHYGFNTLQGFPTIIETTDTSKNQIDSSKNYLYDAVGRQSGTSSTDGVSDVYTKFYDAEDHLVQEQLTSAVFGARSPQRVSLAYQWGPAGNPFAVGSTSIVRQVDAQPTDFQYDSLYWDDDALLFTVNSAGQIDDLKVGSLGDYIPSTATLWVTDRDNVGIVRDCHTAGGGAATGANTSIRAVFPCNLSPVLIPSRTVPSLVGRGAILVSPKTDGFTDGFNTFQGVRTFDPQAGVWNTPDAYRGVVHDPMTQKPYMWNRNNPYAYADPSGYNYVTEPLFVDNDLFTVQQSARPAVDDELNIFNITDKTNSGVGGSRFNRIVRPSYQDRDAEANAEQLNAQNAGFKTVDQWRQYQQKLAEAEARYPAKVGNSENHHVEPKYLGGDPSGRLVRLPAPYHQKITNEFRDLAPYGRKIRLAPNELQKIIDTVYGKYPIPGGH